MNKRAEKGQSYEPTAYEHFGNILTHGVGLILCANNANKEKKETHN